MNRAEFVATGDDQATDTERLVTTAKRRNTRAWDSGGQPSLDRLVTQRGRARARGELVSSSGLYPRRARGAVKEVIQKEAERGAIVAAQLAELQGLLQRHPHLERRQIAGRSYWVGPIAATQVVLITCSRYCKQSFSCNAIYG